MKIRAVTHVHSDWSHDGSWPLPKIASFFKKWGLHCALTSEHAESFDNERWLSYRKACAANSDDGFLLVPGIEYSDSLNIIHILTWGDIPFLGTGRETSELLREVRELGGVAVMAHPARREAWQRFSSQWVPFLAGVEQWNRKADGVAPCREALSLIEQNPGLLPFVGLDFHRLNQFFPLSMEFQLNGSLKEEELLNLLRRGKSRAMMAGISTNRFSKGSLFKTVCRLEHFRRCLRRMIRGEK